MILKFIGGLAVILGITSVIAINWGEITFRYNKIFWEPSASSLDGISIDDTRSNVIFNKGTPDNASENAVLYKKDYMNKILVVYFDEDDTVNIITLAQSYFDLPFSNVEEMGEILGKEDIVSISENYESRRYTYLKWGITYSFTNNRLESIMIGDVRWRQETNLGEYIVKGRKICPSEDCPWDEDGKLKPDYEAKDYRDFLTE